jgi:glycine cleavage system H protein
MNVPTDCRYAKSHEWAKQDGDSITVGISDFAQHELGDVVFVELPPAGSKFKKDEAFGVIESVKAASDLFLPVGGEITAINEELNNNPALVNQDPYGAAWLVKLKPSNTADFDTLMDAAAYETFTASQGSKH